MSERFLVTGAMGCLGSWAVKRLIGEGVAVTTFDIDHNPYRMRLIMEPAAVDQVDFVQGDVTELHAVERLIADKGITHILHLAALQVPFCRADPVRGMEVNVVGTTVVLEAAKRQAGQVSGLVYCSSVAAYGDVGGDPGMPLGSEVPLDPNTIYGITKQANEATARVYWQDHGLSSVGLRPHTVYGIGRDQGMTSIPTKAMLAAAAGRPYRIAIGGTWTYQQADDAAACLISAARSGIEGAPVFNMGGNVLDMTEVVAAIEDVVPEVKGSITVAETKLPLPSALDDSALMEAILGVRWRPFAVGVEETVATFRRLIASGDIDVERGLN
jgi:nucleoside-diphosphate-sugar epimerase